MRLFTIAVAALLCNSALAAEPDPCKRFTWDVSLETEVMKQSPQLLTAAAAPTADVPQLELDKLYELRLRKQSEVKFAVPPARAATGDDGRGGLVQFRSAAAGRYRISLSTRHWIDVVDGTTLIDSRDFQGAGGCERPHKVVDFDLPANRSLTLQLSRAPDTAVAIAVTRTSR
jgi:hypothetical protein